MRWCIQAILKILRYEFQVCSSRLDQVYNRHIWYGMPLAVDISDIELSAPTVQVSAPAVTVAAFIHRSQNVQMYCDAPSS